MKSALVPPLLVPLVFVLVGLLAPVVAVPPRMTTTGGVVKRKTNKKKTTSLLSSLLGTDETTLYDNEPDVIEYQDGDEETDFRESVVPRIVQFYSPQCIHCVRYKPSYVKLARDVHQDYPLVEFYAVSCAAHVQVCNEYKVRGTPTLVALVGDGNEKVTLKGRITARLVNTKLQLSAAPADQTPDEEAAEAEARRADEIKDGELEEDYDDNPIDETGGFEEEAPPEPENDSEDSDDPDEDDNYNKNVQEEEEQDEDYREEAPDSPDGPPQPQQAAPESDHDSWFPQDVADAMEQPAKLPRAGASAVRAARLQAGGAGNSNLSPAMREKLRQRLQNSQHDPSSRLKWKRPPKPGFRQSQQPQEGATDTMKAHQAHTDEFHQRRSKILAHIEQRDGKRAREKVEKHWNEILKKKASRTNAEGKAKLPFKKAAPNRMKFGERIPLVRRAVKMGTEESLILDTTLAVISGLKLGLYRKGPTLDATEKQRLRDWLQLLSVAMPQEWGIHDLIDDLLLRTAFVSQNRKNLLDVLAKHAPRRQTYSPSCRRTEIPFNCGFWKLLHTVTVGVAEHKGGLSLIDDGSLKEDARTFAPVAAADVIRNYMESFFPCPYCSSHFVKQYDDCNNLNRCIRLAEDRYSASDADWKELAKWLWEFHNSVSVRILQDKWSKAKPAKSSVTDQIAVLWPTIDSCIRCFDNEGGWDEDAVFLHLEAEYWPESDPDPQTARLLRLEKEMIDPTGSGLTMVLFGIGIILFCVMRQSISKESVQRAILVAKTVRTGTAVGTKRKD